MYTVVIDTVVFVRALLNPRSIWGRLVFDCAGHYRLVVSAPIVREVIEVIQRPELVRKFPRALPTRTPTTILDILTQTEAVEITDAVPAITRDPKDDKFLITAALAGADYLVTEDTDILDDFTEYEGVRIATAAAFLQVLEEQVDHN